ncbi:signaling peptide protein [Bacillus halotolerans]|uniref:intercompartmental signaling factor BofC n=1 Tax=Bacillus halotolerans TaxID=260554 RepID=UPI000CD8E662|nr:intercompartmental signaling factor BofC [Bacillus halotolerans]MCM3354013.1 intercompartmental signaling factor BofC [Bacillus halotolerans]POM99254.1 signaling peptide protein [Bacillus halotolerans]PRS05669.1 signaling peptide protein [Bacillus halotolerans]QDK66281.1 signaling peptide protein [Bacillus halotolerans]QKS05437.1 BofC C-terminal domain-containing protein [Bacillus halotolerans]
MKRFSTAYLLLGILCSAAAFLMGAPRASGAEVEHYEPLQVHVQLEKVYLDGEVSIEHKREKVLSMDDFWADYAGWTLVEHKNGYVLFRKQVDDISPLSKVNGYIGVSGSGVISTFHGRPESDSEPIQSFFQIDLERLESHMQKNLEKGIPFRTKAEFEDVIEHIKTYSG